MTIGLENFTMLAVIGKGNFGKVVLARKKDNQRTYAIKIIKKSKINKDKQCDQIFS